MSNDQVKRSDIFYVNEPAGVMMMWRGEVVERYASVEALVEGHLKGQQALVREMGRVVQAQYRPNDD
jgi:hypothetical protein